MIALSLLCLYLFYTWALCCAFSFRLVLCFRLALSGFLLYSRFFFDSDPLLYSASLFYPYGCRGCCSLWYDCFQSVLIAVSFMFAPLLPDG